MLDVKNFRFLIYSALERINQYSEEAEELLIITAATESKLGTYLYQLNGPARGIFQMEPATEKDIWDNYLRYKPYLAQLILTFTSGQPEFDLIGNIPYQICIARAHYLRFPEKLPKANETISLCTYYKKYWNTYKGSNTIDNAYKDYKILALKEKKYGL